MVIRGKIILGPGMMDRHGIWEAVISMGQPGKLIVFEGGEGCGKTTQLQRLYGWMMAAFGCATPVANTIAPLTYPQGGPTGIHQTREPGGTDLGQMLRGILLGQEPYQVSSAIDSRTELLLYAADRAQHVTTDLRPRLQRGEIVLCDRYTASTIAYQGYGRGLDRGLIEQLNAIATNGLQSDLTLWLDLDVEVGLARTRQRGATDRMEQSDLAFHQRVRQGFQALAQADPGRMVRIEALGTADEVFERIQTVVAAQLDQWYGG
ncbi:MAG: dTMP kinase [Leptolyngbyaceae bacterium]|nr:dTMP kinase [Leptolyngbyaceae bacterium]